MGLHVKAKTHTVRNVSDGKSDHGGGDSILNGKSMKDFHDAIDNKQLNGMCVCFKKAERNHAERRRVHCCFWIDA